MDLAGRWLTRPASSRLKLENFVRGMAFVVKAMAILSVYSYPYTGNVWQSVHLGRSCNTYIWLVNLMGED